MAVGAPRRLLGCVMTMLLAFVAADSPVAAAAAEGSAAAWVELTDRGAEVRAVATGADCPDLTVNGHHGRMSVRALPSPDFPVTVCRFLLARQQDRAVVAGQVLPAAGRRPDRVLIFGDTGCRLKGAAVQDCNRPRAWPFPVVARIAARRRPDLVIHVGDYYYRETPCPARRSGCAGSPSGDNWASWRADFFDPAAPLLAVAPWVFVRGNHENCARGGEGWFRLLDQAEDARPCAAGSLPFSIRLDGLNLYVADSADAEDRAAPADAVKAFAAQIAGLRMDAPGWLLTHRPVWGFVAVASLGPIGPLEIGINATEQAAVRDKDLSQVQMVVSGHIHHFAALSFGASRPAQLIAGTGGDVADDGDTARIRRRSQVIDGQKVDSLTFARFGYFLLDRAGADWTGSFRDMDDRMIARCRLHDRELRCSSVP